MFDWDAGGYHRSVHCANSLNSHRDFCEGRQIRDAVASGFEARLHQMEHSHGASRSFDDGLDRCDSRCPHLGQLKAFESSEGEMVEKLEMWVVRD